MESAWLRDWNVRYLNWDNSWNERSALQRIHSIHRRLARRYATPWTLVESIVSSVSTRELDTDDDDDSIPDLKAFFESCVSEREADDDDHSIPDLNAFFESCVSEREADDADDDTIPDLKAFFESCVSEREAADDDDDSIPDLKAFFESCVAEPSPPPPAPTTLRETVELHPSSRESVVAEPLPPSPPTPPPPITLRETLELHPSIRGSVVDRRYDNGLRSRSELPRYMEPIPPPVLVRIPEPYPSDRLSVLLPIQDYLIRLQSEMLREMEPPSPPLRRRTVATRLGELREPHPTSSESDVPPGQPDDDDDDDSDSDSSSDTANRVQCCICLGSIKRDVKTLNCSHTFHDACIKTWVSTRKLTCPVCRRYFSHGEFEVDLYFSGRSEEDYREDRFGFDSYSSFRRESENEDSEPSIHSPYLEDTDEQSSDSESLPDLDWPDVESSNAVAPPFEGQRLEVGDADVSEPSPPGLEPTREELPDLYDAWRNIDFLLNPLPDIDSSDVDSSNDEGYSSLLSYSESSDDDDRIDEESSNAEAVPSDEQRLDVGDADGSNPSPSLESTDSQIFTEERLQQLYNFMYPRFNGPELLGPEFMRFLRDW